MLGVDGGNFSIRDASLGGEFRFWGVCLFAFLSHWKSLQIWEKRSGHQAVEVQTRWPKLAKAGQSWRYARAKSGEDWEEERGIRGIQITIGLERVLEGAWKLCLSLSFQTKTSARLTACSLP